MVWGARRGGTKTRVHPSIVNRGCVRGVEGRVSLCRVASLSTTDTSNIDWNIDGMCQCDLMNHGRHVSVRVSTIFHDRWETRLPRSDRDGGPCYKNSPTPPLLCSRSRGGFILLGWKNIVTVFSPFYALYKIARSYAEGGVWGLVWRIISFVSNDLMAETVFSFCII